MRLELGRLVQLMRLELWRLVQLMRLELELWQLELE